MPPSASIMQPCSPNTTRMWRAQLIHLGWQTTLAILRLTSRQPSALPSAHGGRRCACHAISAGVHKAASGQGVGVIGEGLETGESGRDGTVWGCCGATRTPSSPPPSSFPPFHPSSPQRGVLLKALSLPPSRCLPCSVPRRDNITHPVTALLQQLPHTFDAELHDDKQPAVRGIFANPVHRHDVLVLVGAQRLKTVRVKGESGEQ